MRSLLCASCRVAERTDHEAGEDLVTDLRVELRRLEVEGVQPDVPAAANDSFALCRRHQPLPPSRAAVLLGHPQPFDLEPAPHGCTSNAAHHLPCVITEKNGERPGIPRLASGLAVLGQSP